MQDLQGSLLGRKVVHLPSGAHSWPAVEEIQGPRSGLEEVGAGTGLLEEQMRHQGH